MEHREIEIDDLRLGPSAAEEVAALAESTPRADEKRDPFVALVRVLEDVAQASGAVDAAVAGLRMLLGVGRLDTTALPDRSVEALVAGMQLERSPGGLKRTDGFTESVLGWQGILRGESEDFDACGAAALDEWAAQVIARVLGTPALVPGLRCELRKRGVAAFGLVSDAA